MTTTEQLFSIKSQMQTVPLAKNMQTCDMVTVTKSVQCHKVTQLKAGLLTRL